MKQHFDIAIVGGGIAGVTLAHRLIGQRSVLLLEMEEALGQHATNRNASSYNENYGPPLVCDLTRLSKPFYASYYGRSFLRDRGMLLLADAAQEQDLTDRIEMANQRGSTIARVELSRAREIFPHLAPEVQFAAWDSSHHDIQSIEFFAHSLDCLQQSDTVLRTTERVEGLDRRDRWQITTDKGTYTADVLVNAAGAWAGPVGQMAGGSPIEFTPLRRSFFVFRPANHEGFEGLPMFRDARESYYARPDGDAIFASPADVQEMTPQDVGGDDAEIDRAIDCLQRQTGLRVGEMRRRGGGFRTFTPDRSPVVGSDPAQPGLFWLAGQGGYGVKVAPALAELASRLLCGDRFEQPDDPFKPLIDALSPARFTTVPEAR